MSRHDRRGMRPELIKRIVIYGALVLIMATAQGSFFAQLDILPATPDLMIGVILSVALLDSVRSAAVVGICGGFLVDALGSSGSGSLSALLYLISATVLGLLAQKMLPRFLSWLCLLLPALAMRALFTSICMALSIRALPPLRLLGSILVPELIVTALLCIPIYPIVKLCVIPMDARSRFTF